MMLLDSHRPNRGRLIWTLVFGFFLGALLTKLCVMFLPESAARTFLTTSVSMSFGPLSVDLVAVAFTLGPVSVYLNVVTLAGVFLVMLIARSLI